LRILVSSPPKAVDQNLQSKRSSIPLLSVGVGADVSLVVGVASSVGFVLATGVGSSSSLGASVTAFVGSGALGVVSSVGSGETSSCLRISPAGLAVAS
jgi:hypothetical protein